MISIVVSDKVSGPKENDDKEGSSHGHDVVDGDSGSRHEIVHINTEALGVQ